MNQDARKIGFNVLLGIAFYLPLEDFVLRWLPFPKGFLIALRQAPEILVWIVALGAAALHLTKYGTIRVIGRRIDRFLIGFIAVGVGTMFLNHADVFAASVSLKALLRYIPLIYALIMLTPEDEQLARIPRVIIVAFGIQAVIGIMEWLGGQPVRGFFSVVHAWGGYNIVGLAPDDLTLMESYDINGTIARPVAYAYFVLVCLVVWVVRFQKRPWVYAGGVGMALLLTFQAHSRMAVFATILVVVMHQIAVRGLRRTIWLTTLLLPLVAAITLSMGTSLTENLYFLDVFSAEYQENARTQRLGLILTFIPNLFNGGITLLGHSSDVTIVAAAVGEHFNLSALLTYVFIYIVEDVYWLALLLYYGFIGFTCFVLFYGKLTALVVRLYRLAREGPAKQYALIAVLLMFLTIPLNGTNQTFEVRQYAYYLWMFVGIAIVAAQNALRKEPEAIREAE